MQDTKEVLKKKMEKYKVLAICGEAGSGKDTLATILIEELRARGVAARNTVSYTTRPKRDYEEDGVNYHFVSKEELLKLILEEKILEATEFNDWFYATGIDDLEKDKVNIAVLNPEGIESLSYDNRIDMCIVRCQCYEKTRLIRQLERELDPDIDEIIRRLKADREDFYNFKISNYSNWTTVVFTEIPVWEEVSIVADYVELWTGKDN